MSGRKWRLLLQSGTRICNCAWMRMCVCVWCAFSTQLQSTFWKASGCRGWQIHSRFALWSEQEMNKAFRNPVNCSFFKHFALFLLLMLFPDHGAHVYNKVATTRQKFGGRKKFFPAIKTTNVAAGKEVAKLLPSWPLNLWPNLVKKAEKRTTYNQKVAVEILRKRKSPSSAAANCEEKLYSQENISIERKKYFSLLRSKHKWIVKGQKQFILMAGYSKKDNHLYTNVYTIVMKIRHKHGFNNILFVHLAAGTWNFRQSRSKCIVGGHKQKLFYWCSGKVFVFPPSPHTWLSLSVCYLTEPTQYTRLIYIEFLEASSYEPSNHHRSAK
jgi:hypothetical protein